MNSLSVGAEAETVSEKLERPARQWHCAMLVLANCANGVLRLELRAGDRVSSVERFPSKDVADTFAAEWMTRADHALCFKYVGAFPVSK